MTKPAKLTRIFYQRHVPFIFVIISSLIILARQSKIKLKAWYKILKSMLDYNQSLNIEKIKLHITGLGYVEF